MLWKDSLEAHQVTSSRLSLKAVKVLLLTENAAKTAQIALLPKHDTEIYVVLTKVRWINLQ